MLLVGFEDYNGCSNVVQKAGCWPPSHPLRYPSVPAASDRVDAGGGSLQEQLTRASFPAASIDCLGRAAAGRTWQRRIGSSNMKNKNSSLGDISMMHPSPPPQGWLMSIPVSRAAGCRSTPSVGLPVQQVALGALETGKGAARGFRLDGSARHTQPAVTTGCVFFARPPRPATDFFLQFPVGVLPVVVTRR